MFWAEASACLLWVVIANLSLKFQWAKRIFWLLSVGFVAADFLLPLWRDFLFVQQHHLEQASLFWSNGQNLQPKPIMALSVALVSLLLMVILLIPKSRRFCLKPLSADPDSPLHLLGALLLIAQVKRSLLLLIIYHPESALIEMGSFLNVQGQFQWFVIRGVFILAGAGWLSRRGFKQCLDRLGLPFPTAEDWRIGLGCVALLWLSGYLINHGIVQPFFPDTYQWSEQFSHAMILPGEGPDRYINAFLLATMAGLGEESLYRGLLFPVFGSVLTAFLFAVRHSHFGPNYKLLVVFAHGLVFAWLRKRYSTTTAVISHATFDFIALLSKIY